jgi:hypothetical protein
MQANFMKMLSFIGDNKNDELNEIVPTHKNFQVTHLYSDGITLVYTYTTHPNNSSINHLRKARFSCGIPTLARFTESDVDKMVKICPKLQELFVPVKPPMFPQFAPSTPKSKQHQAYKGLFY